MRWFIRYFLFAALMTFGCLHFVAIDVGASEKEERIRLLQEKMKALKVQLELMQETKLRQQPPTELPWQPIREQGQERVAYAQYVYLLGAQMSREDLDSTLQQAYYIAAQDEMQEKGALFVVPALSLAGGQQMNVDRYNRQLAVELLQQVGVPSAIEGGVLISAKPLDRLDDPEREFLFIDLAGCDRILRARIFELLTRQRLFSPDGTIHAYLWELIKQASPQTFSLFWQGNLAWLAVGND